MTKTAKIVVFIPSYNEEDCVGRVVGAISEGYRDSTKNGFEIQTMVVNDGSSDGTEEAARRAGVERIVRHRLNRGLGAATRTGMKAAREMGADIAVKIDADFQHDPQDIEKVIRPILDGEADVVFGSRFMGEIKYKMPLHRRLGNAFFSFLVRQLTGLKVTDAQTGLMAFSREYLQEFEIVGDYNETQQLIIDAWGKHYRIIEVPVVFHPRTSGRSFISLRYPLRVLPTILRMMVRANPMKVFVPPGLLCMLLGLLTAVAEVAGLAPEFIGDATIVVFLMGGLQIMMFGLLADLWRQKR